MSRDIEDMCKSCTSCSKVNTSPLRHLTVPWPRSKFPFERVHIDLFHFKTRVFLIIGDAFRKWLHVQLIPNTTAQTVICELSHIFAIWGYPFKLVADNGPHFATPEFLGFCTKYNILRCPIATYSPESNGFAEKSVSTAKKAMEKLILDLELASNNMSDFQLNNCQQILVQLSKYAQYSNRKGSE